MLHLANLFSGDGEEGSARPPPVVSFGMGTLGFLTPFDVANYEEILGCILRANEAPMYATLLLRCRNCTVAILNLIVAVAHHCRYATLRTRLRCEVTGPDAKLTAVSHVVNECVIDCESHLGRLCTLETVRSPARPIAHTHTHTYTNPSSPSPHLFLLVYV